MLIFITRHKKVFFEKIYLSNIESDVTMSKILFLALLHQIFIYARPIPIQTKVHFRNLQFLAVTYDMGVLSCAFDVV